MGILLFRVLYCGPLFSETPNEEDSRALASLKGLFRVRGTVMEGLP